jgi:hypothetical protein
MSTILISSCKKEKNEYLPIVKKSSIYQGKVKEVKQGGNYTYLFINERDQDYWVAANKIDVKVGETVYFEKPLVMKNFKSEELDKVFDQIVFVQNISLTPKLEKSSRVDSLGHKAKKEIELKENIKVDPAPGGITIGDLYKNQTKYANKKVKVRGQVVKVNNNIMDRNWVHLKDGTSDAGKSDLTFTTLKEVKVGDIVTLEGIVTVNKKYGVGYVYPLIVEGVIIK